MKLNPRDVEKAMKRMGIQSQEIDAVEVVIKTPQKDIIISNPTVARINMMGQDSFQVSGEVSEREKISTDDIKIIMEKTGASEEDASKALEETGDIAESILRLKKG